MEFRYVSPLLPTFDGLDGHRFIGSELAKVPPEQLDLVDPPPPDVDSADPEVRSKYIQQVQNNAVSRANNHSERCNVNYKLEIAKAVRLGAFRTIIVPDSNFSSSMIQFISPIMSTSEVAHIPYHLT